MGAKAPLFRKSEATINEASECLARLGANQVARATKRLGIHVSRREGKGFGGKDIARGNQLVCKPLQSASGEAGGGTHGTAEVERSGDIYNRNDLIGCRYATLVDLPARRERKTRLMGVMSPPRALLRARSR